MKENMSKFGTLTAVWMIGLAVGTSIIVAKTLPSEPAQPQHKMTVEEYKALAKVVSYDQLARNPKDYLKTIVKLEGKVVQAGDGFLRVDVNAHVSFIDRPAAGLNDGIVYVGYKHKSDEPRILEGDKVRFWGRYDGIVSYKAVLGHTIEVPNVTAGIVEDAGVFEAPKPKPITFEAPKLNPPKIGVR
jgi:hypothetical protein